MEYPIYLEQDGYVANDEVSRSIKQHLTDALLIYRHISGTF
jgi:hypothetical protein